MPGQESEFHSEGTGEPLKASEQRGDIKVNLYSEVLHHDTNAPWHIPMVLRSPQKPLLYLCWVKP